MEGSRKRGETDRAERLLTKAASSSTACLESWRGGCGQKSLGEGMGMSERPKDRRCCAGSGIFRGVHILWGSFCQGFLSRLDEGCLLETSGKRPCR